MAGLKDKRGFIDKERLDLSERQAVEYWMKRCARPDHRRSPQGGSPDKGYCSGARQEALKRSLPLRLAARDAQAPFALFNLDPGALGVGPN